MQEKLNKLAINLKLRMASIFKEVNTEIDAIFISYEGNERKREVVLLEADCYYKFGVIKEVAMSRKHAQIQDV